MISGGGGTALSFMTQPVVGDPQVINNTVTYPRYDASHIAVAQIYGNNATVTLTSVTFTVSFAFRKVKYGAFRKNHHVFGNSIYTGAGSVREIKNYLQRFFTNQTMRGRRYRSINVEVN